MLKRSSIFYLLAISSLISAAESDDLADQECRPGIKHSRASIRNIEAGGIGYNQGYTTIETFIAADPNKHAFMPFMDLRFHVMNNGYYLLNFGMGGRSILGGRVYGLNAYYDYRERSMKNFNQIGVGFETLGKLWDIRINGYFPFGSKTISSDPWFHGFYKNSILVDKKYKYAMTGVNGELGFHFGKTRNFDFYGAVGPYYFKGDIGSGAVGGKARLAAYYKNYVTLEIMDSYDNVFKNRLQGQITLSAPLGAKSYSKINKKRNVNSCDDAVALNYRMVQPVDRQEVIVMNDEVKTQAADQFVIFVNNTSSSLGTYESPYPSLILAQNNSKPSDLIYVYPGDGTNTNMDSGIVLQNNQKLFGSGTIHRLNTNLGLVTIPDLTGADPMISSVSTVVTLANNNEVAGFYLASGAIGFEGNNILDFYIRDNTINATQGASITIGSGNQVEAGLIERNVMVMSGGDGFNLVNNNPNAFVSIIKNSVTSNANFVINGSNTLCVEMVDNESNGAYNISNAFLAPCSYETDNPGTFNLVNVKIVEDCATKVGCFP